jgi:hypothetical protein
MISITKFPINITEYAKLRKANVFPVKYGCKNCGYEGRLHRHGFYQRNAITIFATYRIFILRVKCPSCNKTYSVLPSFLISSEKNRLQNCLTVSNIQLGNVVSDTFGKSSMNIINPIKTNQKVWRRHIREIKHPYTSKSPGEKTNKSQENKDRYNSSKIQHTSSY